MPTKAIKVERQKLIRDLERESLKEIKAVAERVKASVSADYQKTFQHWNGSGINRFPDPSDNFNINERIRYQKNRGFQITLTFGVDNTLWNWLDDGTPDIIQPTTSPPIPERRDLQTAPNDLEVSPFAGFTGRFFRIGAGRLRRGIPARRWTRLIGQRLRDAQKDTLIEMNINAKGESI